MHLFDFVGELGPLYALIIEFIESRRGCQLWTWEAGQRVDVKSMYESEDHVQGEQKGYTEQDMPSGWP